MEFPFKTLPLPQQVKYIIGIDTCYKDSEPYNSYCLVRKIGDNPDCDVILVKTIRNERDFKKEVDDIVKYFNAIKVTEI